MTRHPYQRLRAQQFELPEVGISEENNIRSLHLGSPTIQSSMNLDNPSQLVLSYSRAMMAWLLFRDAPRHITQIGLGGGSFARWIAEYCPQTMQTVVDIHPQVIAIAQSMFDIPEESDTFEIIEADGADYIKTMRGGTDVILVDGFDGEQIIDAFVDVPFFEDCRTALSNDGIFVTNWWQGDKRFDLFVEKLRIVFEDRVLLVPAQTHGNIAVFAFKQAPEMNLDKLKKRAEALESQYGLEFLQMLTSLKSRHQHNGKVLQFTPA
ncbi:MULTISPECIES: polyamine aminopropyltransferase [Vitreoscilla]|uniref:Polyamine aminopropyltransferase n=1 Tax=Vitreoscilla stercoraria TaxID=61 RepID=A0ABY4E8J9_VITST|nr:MULTISPECIES: polyamine aminopropyltransferase [Vitreoscilla]AUZ04169.1 spermidine synthase [Vitreoscilla sp. C1]UOO92065.1 polyamine aminopropyltransferase [Vitreoscilla stercoraria]